MALHLSTVPADSGHIKMVQLLLLYNHSYVDVINHDGCTPLMLATLLGQLELVEILIRPKADIDYIDRLYTSTLGFPNESYFRSEASPRSWRQYNYQIFGGEYCL